MNRLITIWKVLWAVPIFLPMWISVATVAYAVPDHKEVEGIILGFMLWGLLWAVAIITIGDD